MPGPGSSKNTYTCTCTHFCGGYKTGLSWATFYRHAPHRNPAQPSFSAPFQNFLNDSTSHSGTGLEESQENSGVGVQAPQVLGNNTQNSESIIGLGTAGAVSFLF